MALLVPFKVSEAVVVVGGDAFVTLHLNNRNEVGSISPRFGPVHKMLELTKESNEERLSKTVKDGSGSLLPHITSACLSRDDSCMVVTDSLKKVSFFDRVEVGKDWSLSESCVLDKQPRKVIWDEGEGQQQVLVADKSGDVVVVNRNRHEKKLGDDDDQQQVGLRQVLLGHFSMLLDLKLTSDRRHILTCDRDEKLRVSHYPNAYNIRGFCLGHTEYVAAIDIVDDNWVVTASGDGTVRLFDFLNLKQLDCVDCSQQLEDCNALDDSEIDNDIEEANDASIPIAQKAERPKRAVTNVKALRIEDQVLIVAIVQGSNVLPVYKLDKGESRLGPNPPLKFNSNIRDVCFLPTKLLVVLTATHPYIHCHQFDCQSSQLVTVTLNFEELRQDVMSLFAVAEKHELSQMVHFKRWFDNEKAYLDRKKERVKEKQQKGHKRAKS